MVGGLIGAEAGNPMNDDLARGLGDRNNRKSCLRAFGVGWQKILTEAADKVPGFSEFLEGELRASGPHFCACLLGSGPSDNTWSR
jgi:hypothetical protein